MRGGAVLAEMGGSARIAAVFLAAAVLFAARAALAQYLPEPSAVPGGVGEDCQRELEAQRQAIEEQRQRLDPLIAQHESECGTVDQADEAQMSYCAGREVELGGEVDAYFARLDDYEARVKGAPERARLEAALGAKRAEFAKAEASAEEIKGELETATARAASLNAAIEEWADLATEARKQAAEDGLMVITGHLIDHITASKKAAGERLVKQYNETVELYWKNVSPIQAQRELRDEIKVITKDLMPVVSDLDVLDGARKLHLAVTATGGALDLQTRGKIYRGLIDILGIIGGPATQKIADLAKFGESLAYWTAASVYGGRTVDALNEAQGLNLRAISALASRYAKAVDQRKSLKAEIEALEQRLSAIPYGCAGMV